MSYQRDKSVLAYLSRRDPGVPGELVVGRPVGEWALRSGSVVEPRAGPLARRRATDYNAGGRRRAFVGAYSTSRSTASCTATWSRSPQFSPVIPLAARRVGRNAAMALRAGCAIGIAGLALIRWRELRDTGKPGLLRFGMRATMRNFRSRSLTSREGGETVPGVGDCFAPA